MQTRKQTSNQDLASPLHIAMVTETFQPEVNGVVTTLGHSVKGMCLLRHIVHLIRLRQHGQDVALQREGYTETLMANMLTSECFDESAIEPFDKRFLKLWQKQRPDIVHISTAGPLGWSAMSAACGLSLPVVADFHIRFHHHDYAAGWHNKRIAAYLRLFYSRANCTIVPTTELQMQLMQLGFKKVEVVTSGVNQLEKLLLNIVNSQGDRHVETKFSSERRTAKIE